MKTKEKINGLEKSKEAGQNNLQIFNNAKFGKIRTILVENKPYFCLIDVCRILELGNTSRVRGRLNQDGVTISKVTDSIGRVQNTLFINEGNLYKCIFKSNKKEAVNFTEWVTTEVLPQIRNYGMYATKELLNNPDLAIKVFTKLKDSQEKIKQLEVDNKKSKHLLDFAKSITTSNDCLSIAGLAKLLSSNGVNIGQKRLFEYLRNNRFLISIKSQMYNTPYQRYIEQGLFKVSESKYTDRFGKIRVCLTTQVTVKRSRVLY